MKYEVRCCCQPQKLLGWVELANFQSRSYTFSLRVPGERSFDYLSLQLCPFINENGRQYLAFKADGVPLETLRRIPSFIENTDHG